MLAASSADVFDDEFFPYDENTSPIGLKIKSSSTKKFEPYEGDRSVVCPAVKHTHYVTPPPCKALVTLDSLSGGGNMHDSGFVPSPATLHSFTSSSDDDDDDEDESTKSKMAYPPGVTPPINIPHSHLKRHTSSRPHHRQDESYLAESVFSVKSRVRSKSCPASASPRLATRLECLGVVVPHHNLTVVGTDRGGGGSTTNDDRKKKTTGIIKPLSRLHPDQFTTHYGMKNDGRESEDRRMMSHERRVLVLALPDRVDESQQQRHNSRPPPFGTAAAAASLSENHHVPSSTRGRAMSCEVKLEEEVGRKLRWIADSFFKQ